MERRLLLALALALTATLAPTAAGADPLPPPLQNLVFNGSGLIFDDYDFDAATALSGCDPSGTSTISFTQTGTSTGPYPGTYEESVDLTIGPQAAGGGATPGVFRGSVVSLTAQFEIDSTVGDVTGTKTLLGTSSVGSCYGAEAATGADWFRPELLDYVHEHRALSASASYSATIVTADGTFSDAGQSFVQFDETGFAGTCAPASWCTEGALIRNWGYANGGFLEVFFASSGVVPAEVNAEPGCSAASATPATLWAPNHRFEPIAITGLTDDDGDTVTATVTSILQDEPVAGDGSVEPDALGVGTATAEVRAERAGKGNGRVYHIGFTADDGNEGSCTGVVTVGVPKSQGANAGPIDDGALFDSTLA